MEDNKLNSQQSLAIIASDVKKIIKHLKLDRRGQAYDESEQQPPSPELDMLQRLDAKIGELAEQRPSSQEYDLRFDGLENKLEALVEHENKVIKRHEFFVDFRNSKASATIIVMGLIIVGLGLGLGLIFATRTDYDQKDNNLKYRYVRMKNGATPSEVERLEDMFEYNRNNQEIKSLRKRVEKYEQTMKQEAENAARSRLNAEEAGRLRKEAETIKGGK